MSKSKWPQVQDKLMLIEKWARDGLTEEQICLNIGVSVNAFNIYKKQYPELKESLKKGREIEDYSNLKEAGMTNGLCLFNFSNK